MLRSVLSQDRSCMFLISSSCRDEIMYTVFDNDQYRIQLGKLINAKCSRFTGSLCIHIGDEALILNPDEWEEFFMQYAVLAVYMDFDFEPEIIM